MDMVPRNPTTLAPAEARCLLRRLRDLNLVAHEVAVDGGARVTIDGCLSLDGPVEQGVRYRLRVEDGPEQVLELRWQGGGLDIELRRPDGTNQALLASMIVDEEGRTTAHAIGARVDTASLEPRAFEHFLRRVVRGVMSAA